jgi:hypothetical protein
MQPTRPTMTDVMATAEEVLPRFGLAFLVDENRKSWAVTKSMAGPGISSLRTGQKVKLSLDHHPCFSVVRAYAPID